MTFLSNCISLSAKVLSKRVKKMVEATSRPESPRARGNSDRYS